MKHFNQVYLNEGHVISGIYKLSETDAYLDGIDFELILKIVANPRDLKVDLRSYKKPELFLEDVIIRKAESRDKLDLKTFVEKEFGSRWIESIENGMQQEDIPIFLASKNNEIIGFAAYDVVGNTKGIFGPMGVAFEKRTRGVGQALLHNCLSEMKVKGYGTSIINAAGPIEFYEKSCNAVLIPIQI
jgi:N-acetylglutamate synthase-like GNAT family acetyltransferase